MSRGLGLIRWVGVLVGVMVAALVADAALPGVPTDAGPSAPNPPLVGFSFSASALPPGSDARVSLQRLLSAVQPDVVRLPVYWEEVAPSENSLDFSALDALLSVIAEHNAHKSARQTKVVLVLGARNVLWPEIHLPLWLPITSKTPRLSALLDMPAYHSYLSASFERYASLPYLAAWQVENEPLDNAAADQMRNGTIPVSRLRSEISLLRKIDRTHPVIITTFNSAHVTLDVEAASPLGWIYRFLPGPKPAGHPSQALTLGDSLGLDLYVVTGSTSLQSQSAATRIAWKEATLDYWADQARLHGKTLWVTEMQASPWEGAESFTVDDLRTSALAYREHGVTAFLLWGVEGWLTSPDWMKAGVDAVRLLRTPVLSGF